MITHFLPYQRTIQKRYFSVGMLCLTFLLSANLQAQTTETLARGSYIINMGVSPQTSNNALRPYGMIYDLLKNYQVPIKWVINQSKVKDGIDFTHNGVNYSGGPFIIPAEFRTAAVNSRITFWQGQGVIGATTVAPITVPVHTTLYFVPRWTLDEDKGDIATEFFSLASIPASAHGGSSKSSWVQPANLDCCTDLFVMPHADPEWSTHGNLLNWNLTCKGGIWLGCHAGSALENMFNSANRSQQTNFLSNKTGTATGNEPGATDGYAQNSLILWDNHKHGTPAYSYTFHSDPIMQFMGTIDAATQNGSEQVFIPLSPGWRATTKVGVYDPDHPDRVSNNLINRPALLAWGPGLGDTNRGLVMIEASHDIAKEDKPSNIAAIRAFHNFSLIAISGKAVIPSITGLNPTIAPGGNNSLSVSLPPGANINNYTVQWSSDCGGTFSPSSTSPTVTFTAPSTPNNSCKITVKLTDACGRETFFSQVVSVSCIQSLTSTVTQVCGASPNSGVITMNVANGIAPYSYTWTRSGGGSGSGSGTTIPGLSAGTYNVTVTSANGCSSSFRSTVNTSPAIVISPTVTPVNCFGGNDGAIALSVSGGTPAYTYNWGGGITTQNRSNLSVGTYSVTVTDSKGCTATQSGISMTQPVSAVSATPAVTNISCFGQANGSVVLTVSGGTSPYTYLWSDAATTQNRTNLSSGTYAVTVTDALGCVHVVNNITITQPAAVLSASLTATNPTCNGTNNGAVTAAVTGGTAPYTYDWNGTPTGDGTATITNLSPGNYTVTITDANGCTITRTATIVSPPVLSLSVTSVNPTCPPGSALGSATNGSIDLSVTGGTPIYSYSWTTADGAGLTPTTQDQTALTQGTYTVLVTDANGCTATLASTLTATSPSPVLPGPISNN